MKNKDTDEAIMLVMIWSIAFVGGLVIADKWNVAAGLLLSLSVTITVAAILYCDWRNDRTKNRLNNYIDDANERIKEGVKHGAGKDV